MRNRYALSVALATLAIGLLCAPAMAIPIIYSNQGTWEAQMGTPTVVSFNGAYNADEWELSAAGYTASGVNFTGYSFYDSVTPNAKTFIDDWPAANTRSFGTGAYIRGSEPQWSTYAPAYIQVTMPAMTAFGFNLMTYLPGPTVQYGAQVDIWFSDASGNYYYRVDTNQRGVTPAFFGVISPDGVGSVRIAAVGATTALDNFTFGSANLIQPPAGGGGGAGAGEGGETPEVASIIMMVTGLAFLGFGKKRFHRTAPASV